MGPTRERLRAWLVAMAVVCGAGGAASLALAQEPPLLQIQRRFTFTGAALEHRNISAIVVAGDRVVLVDDELRGVLVGHRAGSGTFEFGPPIDLGVPSRPGAEKQELDLEGLVQTDAGIVAIGSHAAVRTSADGKQRKQARNRERQREVGPRPERDVLIRFRLGGAIEAGRVTATVASLRALIDADPILKAFGAVPSKENGIDIEGVTSDGDALLPQADQIGWQRQFYITLFERLAALRIG